MDNNSEILKTPLSKKKVIFPKYSKISNKRAAR